ncbi:MAG: hypothetical protein IPH53_18895 [Flavobacteriales bacterium]|nr:hypothetical protein [Flavobacteriales bacterium]
MFGAIVVVVWRAVHLRAEGLLSSGDITSFVMHTVFIGAGFASIPESIATVLKAIGATERLMDIQDEAPNPSPLDAPAVPLPLERRSGLRTRRLHYATRPDMPVLQDVSFR